MRSFAIREIYERPKPKFDFGFWWRAILLFIITLPFRPLTSFSKGYTVIDNSVWEFMYDDKTLKIERKQVAANGFDECIPFYQFSCNLIENRPRSATFHTADHMYNNTVSATNQHYFDL